MRTIREISALLDELATRPAASLEDQDLDFKEWNTRSMSDAVALAVDMAICMANGGGGTVVFGVHDKRVGRAQAILGVPPEVDVNRLKKAVYDNTDPKLTPVFETLSVPEGTGRLLLMQVHPGLPPYTDTAGKGKIRVGTDCSRDRDAPPTDHGRTAREQTSRPRRSPGSCRSISPPWRWNSSGSKPGGSGRLMTCCGFPTKTCSPRWTSCAMAD